MTCLRFLVSKGKLWLGGENPTVKQVWLSDEVPGLSLTEDSLKPGDSQQFLSLQQLGWRQVYEYLHQLDSQHHCHH